MNSSQFMDKQILNLSGSSPPSGDFFNLFNPSHEDQHPKKKDEIVLSYDFQPVRSFGFGASPASSSSLAAMDLETTGGGVSAGRSWNSTDPKANDASGVRSCGSLETQESFKVTPEKDSCTYNAVMVSDIDQTMKKHTDNLLHALEGVSARLSQLESRTRNLESLVDDLKLTVANNNGSADGKLRQLENILREVQTGVQVLRDKQEIVDAHLELVKLQHSKGDNQVTEKPSTQQTDTTQEAVPQPQESIQHHMPSASLPQPSQAPAVPLPNAPLPPLQQNPPQVQLLSQLSLPPMPLGDPYFPQPGQPIDAHHQQYQMPGQHLPPSHQQYQAPQQLPQYSQPAQFPQQHQLNSPGNPPPQLPPPPSHHPEESPYILTPQTYPPNIHQPALLTQPPSGSATSQQMYRPTSNTFEPSGGRPSSGQPLYAAGYSFPSGPNFSDSQPYSGPPSHYSSVKPPQHSPTAAPTGSSSYPRLPTAQILPQALPTATSMSAGPSSGGTGTRVPIDDVVDKVATMGFSRDQVRAAVRKLTQNGQSVDLNVVLDKLMNDSETQPQKGWFGH